MNWFVKYRYIILLCIGCFVAGGTLDRFVFVPTKTIVKRVEVQKQTKNIVSKIDREELKSLLKEVTAKLTIKNNIRREVVVSKSPDGTETRKETETNLSEVNSETNTKVTEFSKVNTKILAELSLLRERFTIDTTIKTVIENKKWFISGGLGYQIDGFPNFSYNKSKLVGMISINRKILKVPFVNSDLWMGLWATTNKVIGIQAAASF